MLLASFLLAFCTIPKLLGQQTIDEAQLDAFVERALAAYSVPGCAVGVVKDGDVIFSKGYGLADVEDGREVDTATQFQVQSVAKTFTATAIMQLKEQSLIKLDDLVVKHIPYFYLDDDRHKNITIKMLLNHTSGVPTIYKAEFGYENPELDENALKRHVLGLKRMDMEFSPGEKYAYTNNGYAILAALIESVSKIPFEEYMRRSVLDPIEMRRSSFSIHEIDEKNFASPHILGEDLGPAVCSYQPYNRWAASSGGLFSSIEDMCRWIVVSMRGGRAEPGLLEEESYEEMWSVSSDKSERMGLGWFIDNWRGRTLVSHPGGGLGYSAELCLFTEENLGIVVLCNSRKGPTWDIVKAVYSLVHGRSPSDISLDPELKVLNRIREAGIDAGIRYYRELRGEISADRFSSTQLLVLGHMLINSQHENREHMARKIFELAAEYYPDEGHVYDFLAEAYLDLALRNYKKAVGLDPSIWRAKDIIRSLESMKREDGAVAKEGLCPAEKKGGLMTEPEHSQADKEAIEETMSEWAAAVREADVEALGALVTDDAEFWTHGAAPLVGREALITALEPFFASYQLEQEFDCQELVLGGDWAFMRGMEINRLTPRDGGETIVRRQRAFSVLRRGADGKWLFARGMTNLPPDD